MNNTILIYGFYAFLICAAIVAGYLHIVDSTVVIALFSAVLGHSVSTVQSSLQGQGAK